MISCSSPLIMVSNKVIYRHSIKYFSRNHRQYVSIDSKIYMKITFNPPMIEPRHWINVFPILFLSLSPFFIPSYINEEKVLSWQFQILTVISNKNHTLTTGNYATFIHHTIIETSMNRLIANSHGLNNHKLLQIVKWSHILEIDVNNSV